MEISRQFNRWSTRGTTVAMIMILWASFALRLYRLDFQSLWSDEGISLQRSLQPLGGLLKNMPIEHLPGYFVILHGWLMLVGDQDFTLRFFSVWPSLLALALTYRLATDLGSRPAGWIAALLLATNGFQIWYAQEARTYSWLLTGALLASWLFWRMLTRKERPWLLFGLYTLAMTGTVYLHFYGFLVPIAHLLFAGGWWLTGGDRRALGRWALAGVVTFLLFLPWLPRALSIFSFSGWRDAVDPGEIPWRILSVYTVGDTMPVPWRDQLPWLYLALALLGLIGWWRVRPAAALFLFTMLTAPLAVVFALILRNPDFHERYTITIIAPLLLLAAGGLAWMGLLNKPQSARPRFVQRLAHLFVLVVLTGLTLANRQALTQLYTNSEFHKPDYRSAAATIQQLQQPGDVIVTDGIDPSIVFLHYYHGGLPVHDLRPLADADHETVAETLTAIAAAPQRIWEVLFFHEPATVQHWLAQHGWSAPPTAHNGIRVSLYGMIDAQPQTQPLNIAFGPALTLTQATVSGAPLAPNQLVYVTTEWQVTQSLPDYKFSLRLRDGGGQQILAQDYVPQNWFAPTSVWVVGLPGIDQRAILLPPALPNGRYQVTLRLYDPANGVAVETIAGQDVVLGEIEVVE